MRIQYVKYLQMIIKQSGAGFFFSLLLCAFPLPAVLGVLPFSARKMGQKMGNRINANAYRFQSFSGLENRVQRYF
jgi:hypothetical protein